MKKILFGIFAHPDDEAFGPSASLYHAAQTDTDVHLVVITDGEGGTNTDNVPDLGSVRIKEWHASGKLIGAQSQKAFHYQDGSLSNSLYHEIADLLLVHVSEVAASYKDAIMVDFMTYEQGGITGHLDHIATHFITTYVYVKLRNNPPQNIRIGTLKYYCLPHDLAAAPNTDWLYMCCGKTDAHCDEIFDFTDIADKKLEIMRAHHSQREDMKAVLEAGAKSGSPSSLKDHFCYFKD